MPQAGVGIKLTLKRLFIELELLPDGVVGCEGGQAVLHDCEDSASMFPCCQLTSMLSAHAEGERAIPIIFTSPSFPTNSFTRCKT